MLNVMDLFLSIGHPVMMLVVSLIWGINDEIIVQIMKGIHLEFLIEIVELRSYWANLAN